MEYKEIGKMKKGTKFIDDFGKYIITKSGFGTGKNVSVEFEKIGDKNSPTYCLPKKTSVTILSP